MAAERRVQPFVSPRWLETWRAGRTRRSNYACPITVRNQSRRLFVDVSVINRHDAGTGVQRVVRAVASQLLADPAVGWAVRPVGADHRRAYHPIDWPSGPEKIIRRPLESRPGDVFLGLDFALDSIRFHRRQLTTLKRQGTQLWFVMYDLLPIRRPEWFPDDVVVRYRKWLGILAGLADGFYCISAPVEVELREELARRYGVENGFSTHVLPMGWDLAASRPSTGIPPGFGAFLERLAGRPTALMVGTLEPRKGHSDVLAAFDILWERGGNYNLVIVGRPGWRTDALQDRLRNHPQSGERLFWLENASDEALDELYTASHGVIIASLAEGFGLPLVESLGHGRPVLARDLPVFRLHHAKGVDYFAQESDPHALAESIGEWFRTAQRQLVQAGPAVPSWADAARSIFSTLSEEP